MKKILLILLLMIMSVWSVDAGGPLTRRRAVLQQATGGASTTTSVLSGDCTEDFTNADTGNVAAATIFSAETDANSKLSISVNRLAVDTGTGQSGYVVNTNDDGECDIDDEAEITIHFTVEFSDIASVSNASDSLYILSLYDGATLIGGVRFVTAAVTGNVEKYGCTALSGSIRASVTRVIPGFAADTAYDCYVYWKFDSQANHGGCEMKCGGGDLAENIDDFDFSGSLVDQVQFGSTTNSWGDGANDAIVYLDEYTYDDSDTR